MAWFLIGTLVGLAALIGGGCIVVGFDTFEFDPQTSLQLIILGVIELAGTLYLLNELRRIIK